MTIGIENYVTSQKSIFKGSGYTNVLKKARLETALMFNPILQFMSMHRNEAKNVLKTASVLKNVTLTARRPP